MAKKAWKNGDVLRVKNDKYDSQGIPIGSLVKYNSPGRLGYCNCQIGTSAYYLATKDLEPLKFSKTSLENRQKELEDELSNVKTKIAWLKETDAEEFDEDQYKVWQTLTLLENSNLSKLDKTKEITKLLK